MRLLNMRAMFLRIHLKYCPRLPAAPRAYSEKLWWIHGTGAGSQPTKACRQFGSRSQDLETVSTWSCAEYRPDQRQIMPLDFLTQYSNVRLGPWLRTATCPSALHTDCRKWPSALLLRPSSALRLSGRGPFILGYTFALPCPRMCRRNAGDPL